MPWTEPIPDEVLQDVAAKWFDRLATTSGSWEIPLSITSKWVITETPNPYLTQEEWDHHFAICEALPNYLRRHWADMVAQLKETRS